MRCGNPYSEGIFCILLIHDQKVESLVEQVLSIKWNLWINSLECNQIYLSNKAINQEVAWYSKIYYLLKTPCERLHPLCNNDAVGSLRDSTEQEVLRPLEPMFTGEICIAPVSFLLPLWPHPSSHDLPICQETLLFLVLFELTALYYERNTLFKTSYMCTYWKLELLFSVCVGVFICVCACVHAEAIGWH